jgi:hypothetical protein
MLRDWCLLNKPEDVAKLEMWATDRAGEEKLPTGEDNLGHDAWPDAAKTMSFAY